VKAILGSWIFAPSMQGFSIHDNNSLVILRPRIIRWALGRLLFEASEATEDLGVVEYWGNGGSGEPGGGQPDR
jgi:hypothetical protein